MKIEMSQDKTKVMTEILMILYLKNCLYIQIEHLSLMRIKLSHFLSLSFLLTSTHIGYLYGLTMYVHVCVCVFMRQETIGQTIVIESQITFSRTKEFNLIRV